MIISLRFGGIFVNTKVLIIDERSELHEPINDLKARGLHIELVCTKNNYLDIVQEMKPDVIIIDLPQPKLEKEKLYQGIRKISSAPIMVLSVVKEPGIVEKVLDCGADEYLLKPVSPKLLTARIKALARRSYAKSSSQSASFNVKNPPLLG